MMQLSETEENYLKAIFSLGFPNGEKVNTNAIAGKLSTTPASVTDMLKKLSEKELISYEKYKGVSLSETGELVAKKLVRKHRIWEVFLVDKLGFNWDEVHEVAEQLEHIQSPLLVTRLDRFLGYPKSDPHGDPIPDEEGNMQVASNLKLSELSVGDKAVIVGVNDTTSEFLQYLNQLNIGLGLKVTVVQKVNFDLSMEIETDTNSVMISKQVAENLWVKKNPV